MSPDRPIAVAITAMGGQGGGVLSGWIVALAEGRGWHAQGTSVPGVAQRTGATIYYVELIQPRPGRTPVLSLMPVPGEVDVVIAAELMEAGRAIQRGLVSPDRTVLIASTHRSLSMVEKIAPGDGTADSAPVFSAANSQSKQFVGADMQAIAENTGSVISAVLFGALAASGALPFPRDAFEATIRNAGVGVKASLDAFAGGFAAARGEAQAAPAPKPARGIPIGGSDADRARLCALLNRANTEFAPDAAEMLTHGIARLVDYQDIAYAEEYVALVAKIAHQYSSLAVEAARHIAAAMAYDDVIRVADLKTRASRFSRVRGEIRAEAKQIVDTTEYMHPRVEEICATMPAGMGRAFETNAGLRWLLRVGFDRPRRVRTTALAGFAALYLIAGMKRWRRNLLRHGRETAHRDAWLTIVQAQGSPDVALELLKSRRLVKGYSDTHSRGHGKFDKIMGALGLLDGREDAADWVRRLRDAALADADGRKLDGAIATIKSFR
ncbi:MAG: indolepyruvate oxidoreductase subunit beta family protein [Acetobacteraceae bacterium]|nr:indolepyruvate oxidoreductase subunit beta family protein [Acetobacteraceae bacterium]